MPVKYLLIILSVFFSALAEGQSLPEKSLTREDTYINVDVMPVFPGGKAALDKYLLSSIKYPAQAKKEKIEGKVLISFVVDKTGKVKDIIVRKKIEKSLDNEAMRVVQNMPDWIPGTLKDEPVNVEMSLPIFFKLN